MAVYTTFVIANAEVLFCLELKKKKKAYSNHSVSTYLLLICSVIYLIPRYKNSVALCVLVQRVSVISELSCTGTHV